MTWIPTVSGRTFPLLQPRPADIHFPDIAEALGKLCRFTGHCQSFYSVAQHSVLVAEMLPPELRGFGLLHDAHEAYIGDLSVPLQQALRTGSDAIVYDSLRERIDRAVHEAAGLPWPLPPAAAAAVHAADIQLLAAEKRDLLAAGPQWDTPLPHATHPRITPWAWPRAAETFASRLRDWCPLINAGRAT